MKLPFSLPFKKKEKSEYFLALLLRDEKVNAAVFEEFSGKIRLIGKHEEYFTGSLESTPIDELLETLDKTISTAENSLPPNIETQKTIFGVKQNWVENSQIKKEYLAKLKKMCDSLELVPIGFLIISEAIAHLLKKEEGAPVSALLVEVCNKTITITLIKAGRITEVKTAQINDSIVKTTDNLLKHFKSSEILPSRIILSNGEKSEDLIQGFIGHSWSKSLPFLHVPQTTTMPQGYDIKAIILGAATQMGFEVLENTDTKKAKEAEEKTTPIETVKIEEVHEEITYEEDFGFVKEKDLVEISVKEETIKKVKSSDEEIISSSKIVIKEQEEVDYKKAEENPRFKLNKIFASVNLIKNYILKIFSRIHLPKKIAFSLPSSIPLKNKLIFIPAIIVVFSLILILLYFFKLQSTIVISVDPKVTEQNKDILFSTTNSSDYSKNIIAGEVVSSPEEGTMSTSTTGIKEVGDKAKGSVTLYSRLNQDKTFSAGTIITANNLQFTFDNSVNVASVSAADANASTAKASVTAKNIGKESNLPSGVKFTVDSFDTSDVVAKNDTAFSGGTRKEIRVVAKADLDKLASEITKNLESKAKENIAKKISSDNELLPVFVNTTLDKKDFDKKLGDEADKITLKATILYQGISYKKNDLETFSKNLFEDSARDMVISESGFAYDLKNAKQKNDKEISATINIKASFLPKIDNQKLTNQLNGKSFNIATDMLLKLPQASNVSISLYPNIPFLPQILPRIPGNIKLVIKSNE